jgi:tripartite ATP-independent transporter DctP family solute receptor
MSLRLSLFAALLGICAALVSPAEADDKPTVKQFFLAHTQRQDPATVPAAAMAAEFKRQVEERTAGRVKVGIFPSGQLGGNRDMARLVGSNIVQSAFVTVGGVAPLYPSIAVIQMPFVLPTAAVAYRVFDGPFGQHLAKDMEQRTGLTVLGFGDGGGFFAITNNRHPVHSPRDMQGLKIRTIPGFKPLDAMIRSLGATPVEVSSREEFTALASGVVDGQMNPPVTVLANRYDDVQKFVTLTAHLYAPVVWICNHDALAGLEPADQDAVRQSAALALAAGRGVARALEASERGLPALQRRMEVTVPTPAERQAFKAASQPAVAEAIAKMLGDDGSKLLAEFMAAAKE